MKKIFGMVAIAVVAAVNVVASLNGNTTMSDLKLDNVEAMAQREFPYTISLGGYNGCGYGISTITNNYTGAVTVQQMIYNNCNPASYAESYYDGYTTGPQWQQTTSNQSGTTVSIGHATQYTNGQQLSVNFVVGDYGVSQAYSSENNWSVQYSTATVTSSYYYHCMNLYSDKCCTGYGCTFK